MGPSGCGKTTLLRCLLGECEADNGGIVTGTGIQVGYFDQKLECLQPDELVVDLEGVDIGESFKISSIQLPENVAPTIRGRDFVIATLAAPTIIKEPEKPVEETAEGEEGAETSSEGVEGEAKAAEGDKKEADKKEADKKENENKKSSEEKK